MPLKILKLWILYCTKAQNISLVFCLFSYNKIYLNLGVETLLNTVYKVLHHLNYFVMCLIK
jgi:hypothetical protein